MELKIEYLPIEALKPYEKNTRKHQKKDIDNIARSIEKYGMCDAIGIWSDENIIVEGHGRVLACKQLGMTEVPCVRLDHLTDEQRREYAIAHNATAEMSEWDEDLLSLEILELDLDFDFDFLEKDEDLSSKDKLSKKTLESMEIKAFEHHDYIVFVFENQNDWLFVCNYYGLKRVDAGYGETKKVGVGRVLNGKKLLESLQYQDFDFESEQA